MGAGAEDVVDHVAGGAGGPLKQSVGLAIRPAGDGIGELGAGLGRGAVRALESAFPQVLGRRCRGRAEAVEVVQERDEKQPAASEAHARHDDATVRATFGA